MIAHLYLHQDCFGFDDIDDLTHKLNIFIEAKLHAKEQGDETYRHDSIYEAQTSRGPLFELMYVPDALPGDVQQVLVQAIDQNSSCQDRCEEEEDLEIVFGIAEQSGFIGFDFSAKGFSADRCVTNLDTWYHFHRQYYVQHPPERNDMVATGLGSFGAYFPNLYLCPDNLPASLNTLHEDYKRLMRTIIHHLAALNDFFFPEFSKEGKGGDQVCDELENHYRDHAVRIGASRDGGGKPQLNFTFWDSKTGQQKTCYCDLHTKFYRFFEFKDPSPDQRSNRIYFHSPIEGFLGGRILVAHIGKHL